MAFQFRRNVYNEHSMEVQDRQDGLSKGGLAARYDRKAYDDSQHPLPNAKQVSQRMAKAKWIFT